MAESKTEGKSEYFLEGKANGDVMDSQESQMMRLIQDTDIAEIKQMTDGTLVVMIEPERNTLENVYQRHREQWNRFCNCSFVYHRGGPCVEM